ncbi:hypothetical protein MRY82_01350 [bacterium]|nr:hypothetical protein [bacterium]
MIRTQVQSFFLILFFSLLSVEAKNIILYPETHGSNRCDLQFKKILGESKQSNALVAREGRIKSVFPNQVVIEQSPWIFEVSIIAEYLNFMRNKNINNVTAAVQSMGRAATQLSYLQKYTEMNNKATSVVTINRGKVTANKDAQQMYNFFVPAYQSYQRTGQIDLNSYERIFERVALKVEDYVNNQFGNLETVVSEYEDFFEKNCLESFLDYYDPSIYTQLSKDLNAYGKHQDWFFKYVIAFKNQLWLDSINQIFKNKGDDSVMSVQVGLLHVDLLAEMLANQGYDVKIEPLCR